jgi:hypothetical protein
MRLGGSGGTPYEPRNFNRQFANRCRKAAVCYIMGWSNAVMVRRYAHVTARLRRDIADRLNTFLWTANETTNETEPS